MLLHILIKSIIYTKPSLRINQLLIAIMSFNNSIMSIEKFNYADAQARNRAKSLFLLKADF